MLIYYLYGQIVASLQHLARYLPYKADAIPTFIFYILYSGYTVTTQLPISLR